MKYLSLDGVMYLWNKIKNNFAKKTDILTYEEILATTDYSRKATGVDAMVNTWNKQSSTVPQGESLIDYIKGVYHGINYVFVPKGCPDSPNSQLEYYCLILKHTKYSVDYTKVIAFEVNTRNMYGNSVSWDGKNFMGSNWFDIG